MAPNENSPQVLPDFLSKKLKYEVSSSKITTAYRIGKKGGDDHRDSSKMLVNFIRRDEKYALIVVCKTAKPPNFYINESFILREQNCQEMVP